MYTLFCIVNILSRTRIITDDATLLMSKLRNQIYTYFLSSNVTLLLHFFFFLMIRPPPRSTLFPNPTLFRSVPASLRFEGITGASHGLQITRVARIGLDLAAQPGHLHVDVADVAAVSREDLSQSAQFRDRKSTRLNSSHT